MFEKIIKTSPPYDKRNDDPYSVGSMLIWFILKGDKGAIQFHLDTGSYLKHVVQEWADKDKLTYSSGEASVGVIEGWDLEYYSLKPTYEEQSKMPSCDIFPDGCYYDGTSLRAEKPLQIYIEEGEEGLWRFLEEVYNERFGGNEKKETKDAQR